MRGKCPECDRYWDECTCELEQLREEVERLKSQLEDRARLRERDVAWCRALIATPTIAWDDIKEVTRTFNEIRPDSQPPVDAGEPNGALEQCGAMRVATRETCALQNDHEGQHWFASEHVTEAELEAAARARRTFGEPPKEETARGES